MVDDAQTHATRLQFYLCTKKDWARRVVTTKIYTNDSPATTLTGPELLQSLHTLVEQKDIKGEVQVRETSCMRGCHVGPRLNVVTGGCFQHAVRFLHLPANRQNLRCISWAEVDRVESLLDHYVFVLRNDTSHIREKEENHGVRSAHQGCANL